MSELALLIGGLDFGEGPRWHAGKLWYSDFYQNRVYTVDSCGTREIIVNLEDEQPSGLGWLPDGDLLIVAMLSRQVLRVHNGIVSLYADLSDIATFHTNDMVVAEDGTAYVGNFGFDIEQESDNPRTATLAIIDPNGVVHAGPDGLSFPNGSVITPNGKTLIVCETFGSRLTAFPILDDKTLGKRTLWANVKGLLPDGCCLDANGGIWVADALGSGVVRVLEGGEITDRIPTPHPAFACMLGGNDARTLHCITAPASGSNRKGSADGAIYTIRVEYPAAGLP